MKNFFTILKFELKNLLANKVFIIVTAILVLIIAGLLSWPRVDEMINPKEGNAAVEDGKEASKVMLLTTTDKEMDLTYVKEGFKYAFWDHRVEFTESSVDEIKKQITDGEADAAIVLDSPTSYRYFVNNLSMYDSNTRIADEVLQGMYRSQAMINQGISPKDTMDILSKQIEHETEKLGKDQGQNFFYTYFMLMALYMIILLYGQIVATNVASEKSSRAMEVLITSANPVAMMFGKILAACIAGLVQLTLIFGSAYLFFNLNKEYWVDDEIINSIFNMPLDLLLYMLLFFVLGFFLYACMYGAVGSTASKVEDINTSTMPITILFVISFFIVMTGIGSAELDTPIMKAASFIPFTSPIAMFARISMSTVPPAEIMLSVGLLVLGVLGIGVLAAKIYRIGVLLYGTPPKLSNIIKSIRNA